MIKQKNAANKYIENYELKSIDHLFEEKKPKIVRNNIFFFFYLMLRLNTRRHGIKMLPDYYPTSLGSIEIIISISFLIWKMFVKRAIYGGEIKAYYRESYKNLEKFILFFKRVVYGILLRTTVVHSFFAYYVFSGDFPVSEAIDKFKGDYINPKAILPTIFISTIFVYIMYFKEKYITIEEYSRKTLDIMHNDSIKNRAKNHSYLIEKHNQELEFEEVINTYNKRGFQDENMKTNDFIDF